MFGRLSAAVATAAVHRQTQAAPSDAAKNEYDNFDISKFLAGDSMRQRQNSSLSRETSRSQRAALRLFADSRRWIALDPHCPRGDDSRPVLFPHFPRPMSRPSYLGVFLLLSLTASQGCRSPYYADRGALFGG